MTRILFIFLCLTSLVANGWATSVQNDPDNFERARTHYMNGWLHLQTLKILEHDHKSFSDLSNHLDDGLRKITGPFSKNANKLHTIIIEELKQAKAKSRFIQNRKNLNDKECRELSHWALVQFKESLKKRFQPIYRDFISKAAQLHQPESVRFWIGDCLGQRYGVIKDFYSPYMYLKNIPNISKTIDSYYQGELGVTLLYGAWQYNDLGYIEHANKLFKMAAERNNYHAKRECRKRQIAFEKKRIKNSS